MLSIRDVRYQGHATWTYRLTATRRPYLTALYPLAGRKGTAVTLEPVGFNLGDMKQATVQLPAAQPDGLMDLQLPAGAQSTNPHPFLVSDLPQASEQEPNDAPEQATRVELPGGWNGRIGKPLDADRFRFKAAKGQAYPFEGYARRCGSSLDPLLQLLDTAGKPVASNDDAVGKDSRLDWTAPADGEYLLQVADLHSRGGETFVYHVAAAPAKPDFTLQCDDDRALVGPGSGYAFFVLATRRNGFAGEIQLAVEDLPPGVTATAGRIPPHMTQGSVVLRAAPDAAVAAANIRVVGTAVVPGVAEPLRRVAEPLQEIYTPGGGRARYPVRMHTVCVTGPADVLVKLSANRLKLTPGGSAALDVEIVRQNGYDKPVGLDLLLRHLGTVYGNPLPPGVTLDESASKTLLGAADTKGRIVLKAAPDAAPVADLPFAVLGQVSINFVVKVSHASEPVLLTIAKE